jgi:putative ABC transport system substrate-binding protein
MHLRVLALVLALVATPLAAEAQRAGKVPRIGFLSFLSASVMVHREASFRQGMRELGWVDGQNIVIERRFAEGRHEKLHELAAELVRLKVDVIVAPSNVATLAAKQATPTIPIVMVVSADAVGQGFIASLARPGGNVTGLSSDPGPEIAGKRLDLLKEAVPKLSRVGGLIDPGFPASAVYRNVAEAAAPKLGMTLQHAEVREPTHFEKAFAAMIQQRAQAILVYGSTMFLSHLREIVDLTAKHRLPDIYWNRDAVAMGGLMSYGVSHPDLYRRAAAYVDKILKGAQPAEMPVEQPTKFELVINLKTANALGLTIPQALLLQADHVIQ